MRSYWRHIVLAASIGSCSMPAFTFIDSAGNQIPASQPPSETVRLFLQAGDTSANVGTVPWRTDDRRVIPVEIRIALAGIPNNVPVNTLAGMRDPILGYTLELGAGVETVTAPRVAGANSQRGAAYAIPARGVVTRVLARDVIVHVRFDGHFDNPTQANEPRLEWVDIAVSFTPCDDLNIAAPPTAAYSRFFSLLSYQPFPPEAREFRLVTLTGEPYDAGYSRDVYFRNALGGYLRDQTNHDMTFDRAQFGDWTPISPRVAGWGIAGGTGNWDVPGFGGPIPEPATDDSEFCTALYR